VSSPRPDLAGSAMTAVKQYVYRPFLLDGAPVEVDGMITVNYASRR
jgi:Gram-negative bacterial TonB protein C-terminal